ncbi:YheC/YheD family protein [Natranaerobius trueperi]|uniref:ATP-grasp domain-containing protein n=1 Tax=Natranaerobius trueperi TaxID=759412 RepID=A0A226BZ97_9FIRM|nr:YheC/YheD family protein [Natranaerobius trueperi]OWZ84353.1 hypothetical protein CDO51_03565 [Natranaerobius trueperi]
MSILDSFLKFANTSVSPQIGVLITRMDSNHLNKFYNEKIFFLLKANQKSKVDIFFFMLLDIDFENHQVKGYYLDEQSNQFKTNIFAFPDVIYKLGGVLRKEKTWFEKLTQYIEKNNIKTINSYSNFDKWEVHEVLKEYNNLSSYLITTLLYNSQDDLRYMVNRHNSIYIKPTGGRLGKKIMRIDKVDACYRCITMRDEKPKSLFFNNFDELELYIRNYFRNFTSIIQEAIDLLSINEQLVDMRVEVQRNGNNQIEILAIPVRLGQDKAPVTQHATSYKFRDFFSSFLNLSNNEIDQLYKSIEKLTTIVYKTIESYYGQCGEMGIDIGIDNEFNLKLIECNSQPTKVSLINAYEREVVERSFENILNYGKYLSKI